MANIIELSGPPGVGKTTVLNAMSEIWKKDFKWTPYQNLFPRQKIKFNDLANIAENLPFLIKFGKTNLDNRRLYDAGKKFIKENSAYIDAYWNNLNLNGRDANGIDSRFHSAGGFYKILQKYQYIKDLETNDYALFDEGLIHRLPVIGISAEFLEQEKDDICNLINVMPLPAAYIFIDTDTDIILDRLDKRGKVAPIHKNKTRQEIKALTETVKVRMHFAMEAIRLKGVPVLSINTKYEVNYNVNQIDNFINLLAERGSKSNFKSAKEVKSANYLPIVNITKEARVEV